MVPASRVANCRAQYHKLSEQNKSMQAELADLAARSRQLKAERDQSERELIALDGKHRLQLGSTASREAGKVPMIVNDRLTELAERYPGVTYDAVYGVAALDTDVLFAVGRVQLQPRAQEMLADFSAILSAEEARQLRIMAVGHTDDPSLRALASGLTNNQHLSKSRAFAVVDFLRAHGVDGERMGVSHYPRHRPAAENGLPSNRHSDRHVELFLLAPEVAIVGWTESFARRFR